MKFIFEIPVNFYKNKVGEWLEKPCGLFQKMYKRLGNITLESIALGARALLHQSRMREQDQENAEWNNLDIIWQQKN